MKSASEESIAQADAGYIKSPDSFVNRQGTPIDVMIVSEKKSQNPLDGVSLIMETKSELGIDQLTVVHDGKQRTISDPRIISHVRAAIDGMTRDGELQVAEKNALREIMSDLIKTGEITAPILDRDSSYNRPHQPLQVLLDGEAGIDERGKKDLLSANAGLVELQNSNGSTQLLVATTNEKRIITDPAVIAQVRSAISTLTQNGVINDREKALTKGLIADLLDDGQLNQTVPNIIKPNDKLAER